MEENVSEKHSERKLVDIPVMALVHNRPPHKRPEAMSFKNYWKARRNARLALKKREQEGIYAFIAVDPKTMDVVTQREQILSDKMFTNSLVSVKREKKPWVKKTRRGLKLAQGR